jgi:hypothetical protein
MTPLVGACFLCVAASNRRLAFVRHAKFLRTGSGLVGRFFWAARDAPGPLPDAEAADGGAAE